MRLTATAEVETRPTVATASRRRSRSRLALAPALLAIALTAATTAVDLRRHDIVNADSAPGLTIYPVGKWGSHGPPGTNGATNLVGVMVNAPMTILEVKPFAVTPGVETIPRAWFWAPPGISPSGHEMFNGAPGGSCITGSWPPRWEMHSYPVEDLHLEPDDPVEFGYFMRFPPVVGKHTVTGYHITYRTDDDGLIHTISGDTVSYEWTVDPFLDTRSCTPV